MGGTLGDRCLNGGGFALAPMDTARELGASGRVVEYPADLRLFGSTGSPVTLYFFVVFMTEDTASGNAARAGASSLATIQIQPGTAKLFANASNVQVEAAFQSPLAAPQRDTSQSSDGSGEIWMATNGSDTNPGTFKLPVLTLNRARALAQSRWPTAAARAGKSIVIRGGRYINGRGPTFRQYTLSFARENSINWNGMPGNHFKIRGYWGDKEPVVFDNYVNDPATIFNNPSALGATDPYLWQDRQLVAPGNIGMYGGTIGGSEHLTIEGLTIYGAFIEGLDIDNTRNVKVRFVNIYGATKWGMQAFGQNVGNVEITGCKVMGTLLEHGIYIAAGAHGPETAGPVLIHHNELAYNGRNGVQVNGSHEWVRIENNLIYRNNLAGIASTGNAHVQIKGNFIAENLKQGITLLMYIDDAYWDPTQAVTPSSSHRRGMLDWRPKHFAAMGPTFIRDNTIVVRAERYDPSTSETPAVHGAIDIAQWGGFNTALGDYAHFPLRDVRIENNRLHTVNAANIRTQIDEPLPDFRGVKTIRHIRATGNRIFASGGNALFCTPYSNQWCLGGDMRPIATMEAEYPINSYGFGWANNRVSTIFSSMPPVAQFPVGQGRVDTMAFSAANPLRVGDYRFAP
jgi:hypothetical protein